jgi:uncharacterized protein YukE
MAELEVDPDHLRAMATRLDGYADRADRLRQQAAMDQGITAADFPQADWGQRASAIWDDARPVVANGIQLAMQMLAQHAANTTAAAAQYEATDGASADSIRRAAQ